MRKISSISFKYVIPYEALQRKDYHLDIT